MADKEFSLSEEISFGEDWMPDVITVYYIKEFIRKESALLTNLKLNKITWDDFIKERLKLIGNKLI
jgi:hypothetical protein